MGVVEILYAEDAVNAERNGGGSSITCREGNESP